MSAGHRKDKKSTVKTSNTKTKTKKTTSTSTSMVAVTDDVTRLREQIDSSSCVNNGRKYSETKKACWIQACMSAAWYSHHVSRHSNGIATKSVQATLALRSFDVDEERSQTAARNIVTSRRTVLALLCVSCQMKMKFLANFLRRLRTANIVQLPFVSVDLDHDFPAEEIAGVEWCSDASLSLLEEFKIVFSAIAIPVWGSSQLGCTLDVTCSYSNAYITYQACDLIFCDRFVERLHDLLDLW